MCILYASEIKIKIYNIKTCIVPWGLTEKHWARGGGRAEQSFLSKRFQKAIVWGKSLKNKNKKTSRKTSDDERGRKQDCETEKTTKKNMELGKLYALIKAGRQGHKGREIKRAEGPKEDSIARQFPGDYRYRRRRLFMLNSFQQIPHWLPKVCSARLLHCHRIKLKRNCECLNNIRIIRGTPRTGRRWNVCFWRSFRWMLMCHMPPIIEWERARLVGFGFPLALAQDKGPQGQKRYPQNGGRKSAKDVEAMPLPRELKLCSGTYAFKITKFNS